MVSDNLSTEEKNEKKKYHNDGFNAPSGGVQNRKDNRCRYVVCIT